MRALAPMLALVSVAACAAGGWEWRRPDGSPFDEEQLRADIDACEEYAATADDRNMSTSTTSRARPRGGWGNFSFEVCMHERSWKLTLVKPEDERPVPAG